MIVTDASVLVAALGADGAAAAKVLDRLQAERALAAPEVVDLEVIAAWRRLRRSGLMSEERARVAVAELRTFRLRRVRHRHLIERCWELRENVSSYDAAYVALAEAYGATLLTVDRRLAAATGPRCEIEVLGD